MEDEEGEVAEDEEGSEVVRQEGSGNHDPEKAVPIPEDFPPAKLLNEPSGLRILEVRLACFKSMSAKKPYIWSWLAMCAFLAGKDKWTPLTMKDKTNELRELLLSEWILKQGNTFAYRLAKFKSSYDPRGQGTKWLIQQNARNTVAKQTMSQASTYSPAVQAFGPPTARPPPPQSNLAPVTPPALPPATPSTAAPVPSQSPNARKRRLAEIEAEEVEVEEELEKARQRVEALEANRKRLRAERKSLQ